MAKMIIGAVVGVGMYVLGCAIAAKAYEEHVQHEAYVTQEIPNPPTDKEKVIIGFHA